jgi:hypothetical protein
MSSGDSEKGPPGRRRALVPNQSGASFQAGAGDLDGREVGVANGRARQDGDSQSFRGELDERGEFAGFGHNPWGEAGVAAGVLEHRAKTRAGGEGDDWLVAKLVKCEGVAAGQHMTAGNGVSRGDGSAHAFP